MLYHIGSLLIALGRIPGLHFLRDIGRTISQIGHTANSIERHSKAIKKKVKERNQDDEAA